MRKQIQHDINNDSKNESNQNKKTNKSLNNNKKAINIKQDQAYIPYTTVEHLYPVELDTFQKCRTLCIYPFNNASITTCTTSF